MRRRRLLPLVVAVLLGGLFAGGCANSCPAALLTGTLQREGKELVVVQPEGGSGPVERLKWPYGYQLEDHDGRLVVVDFFATVKAGEGDAIRLGGGEGATGTWGVCGLVEVSAPAG